MSLMRVITVTAITILFSFNAMSANRFVKCDYCTSDYDYEIIAEDEATQTGESNNYILIGNYKSKELKKYQVIYIRSFEPEVASYFEVIQRFPSEYESFEFTSIISATESLSRAADDEVPKEIASSAYDLVGSSSTRNDVSDYIVNSLNFKDKLAEFAHSVLKLDGKLSQHTYIMEVKFEDQSKAFFEVTPTIGAPLPLKLILAIDADNNEIPLTVDSLMVAQKYRLAQQGMSGVQKFIEAAARLGVVVIVNGSDPFSMDCRMNASGGVHCTIRTQAH
ncbi:hypothetical protein [Paraferrimonas haliotis]|uniref:Uncharacterized protein n=1 Tax=Paraferrimonas haliotis TaxID=2013866 RepID=A0AA37WWT8_9GAMM|nr:hypothetical protein [Paraferrimonas haliotis]GLS82744.1 hypothetical protein GCM10007894_07210 [Paraferrimonas haliotis]